MYKISRLALAAAVLVAAVSCNPKTYQQINYLQNVAKDTTMAMNVNNGILIQPQDQLSIIVSSRSPELSAMFNLPVASYQAGSEITQLAQSYEKLLGYVVDNQGNIDFPVLGQLHIAGMTRWDLQEKIKSELASQNLLKDAVVTVEFMNFKISVMGEVTRPGTYSITGDKITILGALSLAGDLTIYGKRDNVEVIREQNGKRDVYVLDLRSTDLFNSPAYYLQQNDVVYVQPNQVRAGQSTINENYFKSASFWMSLGSVMVTVANLIIVIARK